MDEASREKANARRRRDEELEEQIWRRSTNQNLTPTITLTLTFMSFPH